MRPILLILMSLALAAGEPPGGPRVAVYRPEANSILPLFGWTGSLTLTSGAKEAGVLSVAFDAEDRLLSPELARRGFPAVPCKATYRGGQGSARSWLVAGKLEVAGGQQVSVAWSLRGTRIKDRDPYNELSVTGVVALIDAKGVIQNLAVTGDLINQGPKYLVPVAEEAEVKAREEERRREKEAKKKGGPAP